MSNTKLENLTIRLEPETREALERLAAREDRPLAYLIRRMLRDETVQRMTAEEKIPRTKEQTLELLESSGEKWAGWLEGLTDEFLAERVEFPAGAAPPSKTRFEMVLSVKEHEMHHRGQLMLIERIVGVVPHLTRQMQERMAAATAKR